MPIRPAGRPRRVKVFVSRNGQRREGATEPTEKVIPPTSRPMPYEAEHSTERSAARFYPHCPSVAKRETQGKATRRRPAPRSRVARRSGAAAAIQAARLPAGRRQTLIARPG